MGGCNEVSDNQLERGSLSGIIGLDIGKYESFFYSYEVADVLPNRAVSFFFLLLCD